MRANVSALEDEEGFRPFQNEERVGAPPRPRDRPKKGLLGDGEQMARPRKHSEEKRSETMRSRVTLSEREEIRQVALSLGLEDSEYIRRRVLGRALPQGRAGGDPMKIAALNAYAVALSKIGNNVNQLAAATHQGRDFVQYWREIGAELSADLTAARQALSQALEEPPQEGRR